MVQDLKWFCFGNISADFYDHFQIISVTSADRKNLATFPHVSKKATNKEGRPTFRSNKLDFVHISTKRPILSLIIFVSEMSSLNSRMPLPFRKFRATLFHAPLSPIIISSFSEFLE